MIKFKCSKCSTSLKAPDEYAGKKVRCNKCKKVIAIPSNGEKKKRDIVAVDPNHDSRAEFDSLLEELSRWEKKAPAADLME
ncbi:hypothetical protein STSP2_02420 [Anaerohalosphaera lusitana]|uniref:Zinc finger/thioredoxin putative domain-containing protein n=1 Tax=Anaerohalosphaera lusitana TaxID=1936003 RepID=A0A1U9NMT3_9BACT|nr:hypothetical protein [Anaerohalosphaera lusitana]AQT69231.1 hypothetical protein STSP2_02420 [Anaerohalosphaera lusitana]